MRAVVLVSLVCVCCAFPQRAQQQQQQQLGPVGVLNPELALENVQRLISDLEKSGVAQIVRFGSADGGEVEMRSGVDSPYLPVVQMHGMGDFAENPLGMVPLKKAISKELGGTYVTNVALGNSIPADILGSFTKIMEAEVDTFAEAVAKDDNLANGFNAIGYSQGSLIIRGFIEKYNTPPIKNFISIHGPMAGVSGFPRCNYSAEICVLFDNFLGVAAYNELSQNILAQANYLRDPLRIPQYLKGNIWLPKINNENAINQTYTSNFVDLDTLVCVKALGDTMVWPNESEWWGFYKDGSDTDLLTMEETAWFKNDTFGLATLVNAGKYKTYTTDGNHLQFNETFLMDLVDTYFK